MLTFEPPYHQKSRETKILFLVFLDQVKHGNYEFEVESVKFEYHFLKIFQFWWFLQKITLNTVYLESGEKQHIGLIEKLRLAIETIIIDPKNIQGTLNNFFQNK